MAESGTNKEQRSGDLFTGSDPTSKFHRELDWSKTPLGPVDSWSATLRSLVANLLPSRMPMMLWWGPELSQIYNDAFAALIGDKHPDAVGQSAERCWNEVWADFAPLVHQALEGEAVYAHELPLLIRRHGYSEETFWTFSFSPITSTSGEVEGLLFAAIDATEAVVRGRRISVLRDIGALSTTDSHSVRGVLDHTVRVLENNPGKVAFAVARLEGEDNGALEVVRSFGTGVTSGAIAPGDPQLLTEVFDTCQEREESNPPSGWSVPVTAAGAQVDRAIHLPIIDRSEDRVMAVLTVGINPHRAFDADYRSFLNLMARQISTALTDARAIHREQERTSKLVELDRVKNRFLQNISHELRTPLTLIMGSHRSLSERSDLPDAAIRDLAVAERATLRLTRLVEGLLDLSRSDEGVLEPALVPTDLAHLTSEIVAMFRSTLADAGLALNLNMAELPASVQVDPEMWSQIVSNLLSNAYKFTNSGAVTVDLSDVDGVIQLVVSDTGIGMTSAEIKLAFERFHRVPGASLRTAEGAGIGLALVHDLAIIHNGDLDIESEPGRGSRFTVRIPSRTTEPERLDLTHALREARIMASEAASWALPRSVAEHTEPSDIANTPSAPSTILVVEDNADLRSYVTGLLTDDGWNVEAVGDASSALTVDFVPDLVLSDVLLPGMDGIELVRILRQNPETREVPIVLLTALASADAASEGLAAGATDYISKPFDPQELRARVRNHAELHRRRNEALRRADEAVEGLEAALSTNRQIGAAVGIVMARQGLTQTEAFQVLSKASQDQNRKLREVAEDVVFTGEVPGSNQ